MGLGPIKPSHPLKTLKIPLATDAARTKASLCKNYKGISLPTRLEVPPGWQFFLIAPNYDALCESYLCLSADSHPIS